MNNLELMDSVSTPLNFIAKDPESTTNLNKTLTPKREKMTFIQLWASKTSFITEKYKQIYNVTKKMTKIMEIL